MSCSKNIYILSTNLINVFNAFSISTLCLYLFSVILPHIGSATMETRAEMSRITAKNILAVLNGTSEAMPAQLKM